MCSVYFVYYSGLNWNHGWGSIIIKFLMPLTYLCVHNCGHGRQWRRWHFLLILSICLVTQVWYPLHTLQAVTLKTQLRADSCVQTLLMWSHLSAAIPPAKPRLGDSPTGWPDSSCRLPSQCCRKMTGSSHTGSPKLYKPGVMAAWAHGMRVLWRDQIVALRVWMQSVWSHRAANSHCPYVACEYECWQPGLLVISIQFSLSFFFLLVSFSSTELFLSL